MRDPSVARHDSRGELCKVRREQPRIERNRNSDSPFRELLLEVAHQPLARHSDRKEIERVRTRSGVLRLPRRPLTLLGARDHFPDGSTAQTTGSELDRLVKAVVQLRPFTCYCELNDRFTRRSSSEPVVCAVE